LQHRMDYLLLSLAAENGWSGLVRLLVEAGAILYEKGTRQSPLAHAVAYGDATALKFLIAKRSPLEGALYRCKDPTLAELLVKAGADMNQDNHPDYNGMTPLEVAVRDENYPMIQFYLNNLKGEENRARQILKARREAYYLQPGPSQDKIMQVLDESFFAWYDTCDMARRSKIMNKIPF
jgi:ankyrin repeat protein